MPELPDKLKDQAYLFVSDELSEKERQLFLKEIKVNENLRDWVHEIEASLNLTKSSFSMKPTKEFLAGQRNILRNKIDALERGKDQIKSRPAVVEKLRSIIGQAAGARQPVWAVATYTVIAFLIGRIFFIGPVTDDQEPTFASTPNIMELLQSGALQNVDMKEKSNGNGTLHFGLRTAQNLEVTGNPGDQLIQQILFYLLLNDENPGNRLKAVKHLDEIPPHDTMKMVLMSSILSDPNPGVRLRSLELLSNYEVDDLLTDACLKVLLEDENEAVRMGSLGILAKSPSLKIIPTLQVVSMIDENEFIRNQSMEILEEIEESQLGEKIESLQ